ncbi:MAG: formylglycine-generating enzyme family protein [Planctomycetota bacterium]|jgi:formylglycine-generating enzyme required for sulfatase activity
MKLSLPAKLGIAVIVIFALTIAAMLLYRPVKVRYYTSKLKDKNIKVRQNTARILLDMNEKEPVFEHYTEQYASDNVEERMKVVEELCAVDKAMMKEIFRNRCYAEQVKIPAGTLTLENGTEVKIPGLYVDKYEVTNEKYNVYMKCANYYKTKHTFQIAGHLVAKRRKAQIQKQMGNRNVSIDPTSEVEFDSDCPVTIVSWQDAKAYVEFLGLRLPKEYEWEYAARAHPSGKLCFGDNEELREYVWYLQNSGRKLHPVGRKAPNNWGLYDMYGNVWEFCQDIYTPLHQSSITESSRKDNFGNLLRGGSYLTTSAVYCIWKRVGYKYPTIRGSDAGFRCVRDVK